MKVQERNLIEQSLNKVRRETGIPLMFAGTSHGDEGRLSLDTFSGESLGALKGLRVGFGNGVGGKAAIMRRPVAVGNYVANDRISHHYDHVIRAERLQSVFGVPIVVGRQVRCVFYGATRDAQTMGDRVLRLAAESARELEQQLAISAAMQSQMTAARQMIADERDGRSGAEWESVREAFTKLRVLAARCQEEGLRDELTGVAESLAVPLGLAEPQPVAQVHLTAREIDVLACVSQGMSNSDAAASLGLSAETIKSYLRSAMRRLGVNSRWEAVVAARRAAVLP